MTTLLSIIITINIKLSTPSSFLHPLHLIINSPPLSASTILICVKYFWGLVIFFAKNHPLHLISNSSPLSHSTILVPLPISFSYHGSSVANFELEIWLEGKVEQLNIEESGKALLKHWTSYPPHPPHIDIDRSSWNVWDGLSAGRSRTPAPRMWLLSTSGGALTHP